MFVDIQAAFEIVLSLAKQGILSDKEQGELADEREKQLEAIRTVEDFATNQIGD